MPRARQKADADRPLFSEGVYAKWRQQRLWLAETNRIEIAIAQGEGDLRKALPLANGIAKSEAVLKLCLRYDAQFHHD